MIKIVPEESTAILESTLLEANSVWCFTSFVRSDMEKLAKMRKAHIDFFHKNGVADDDLAGMPVVLVKLDTGSNLVYVKSPAGWVDVTEADAKELAEVALGMLPARQIFNPTGSLLGDLALAVLAGAGQALLNRKNP